jgi:hypothetical protein
MTHECPQLDPRGAQELGPPIDANAAAGAHGGAAMLSFSVLGENSQGDGSGHGPDEPQAPKGAEVVYIAQFVARRLAASEERSGGGGERGGPNRQAILRLIETHTQGGRSHAFTAEHAVGGDFNQAAEVLGDDSLSPTDELPAGPVLGRYALESSMVGDRIVIFIATQVDEVYKERMIDLAAHGFETPVTRLAIGISKATPEQARTPGTARSVQLDIDIPKTGSVEWSVIIDPPGTAMQEGTRLILRELGVNTMISLSGAATFRVDGAREEEALGKVAAYYEAHTEGESSPPPMAS